MGLALSTDDVAALETRTEGWIAGLQLAALSMHGQDAHSLSDNKHSQGGSPSCIGAPQSGMSRKVLCLNLYAMHSRVANKTMRRDLAGHLGM